MPNCPQKPVCPEELPPIVPANPSILDDLLDLKAKATLVATALTGALGWLGTHMGLVASIMGSVPTAVALAAIAGAAIAFAAVAVTYLHRCSPVDGVPVCASGVIQTIVPSFSETSDVLFPVKAMHNRVDVVIRCRYWPLVQTTQTARIVCNGDALFSPVLQFYYYNSEVCAAGRGAVAGAVVGAIGGVLLACLVGAAIGCATVVLCALAVALAFLIAAACVLIAACVGGYVGRWIGTSEDAENADDALLRVGDYITATGNLITSGDLDGLNVLWFAEPELTIPHGVSPNGRSDGSYRYSYDELELPTSGLLSDGCQRMPVRSPAPV